MSRTKRAVPEWATHEPSDQVLCWIALGDWHYEFPKRCPYVNGRDRKQSSYVHEGFKGEKYCGWGETHQTAGKKFLKRKRAKYLRQFYKHTDREWEV